MLDTLLRFEEAASGFSPMFLLISGIIMLIMGLALWLFGSWALRPLAAVAMGSVVFLLLAKFTDRPLSILLMLSVVAGILAAVFPRVVVAVMAVVFASGIVFVMLGAHYYQAAPESDTPKDTKMVEVQERILGANESLTVVDSYADTMIERMKSAKNEVPKWMGILMVGGALVLIIATVYLYHIIAAFVFSTFGTTLIFSGAIALLLYKQTAPISGISQKPATYGYLFLGMVLFGAVEQIVIFKKHKRKKVKESIDKAVAEGIAESTGEAHESWRGA